MIPEEDYTDSSQEERYIIQPAATAAVTNAADSNEVAQQQSGMESGQSVTTAAAVTADSYKVLTLNGSAAGFSTREAAQEAQSARRSHEGASGVSTAEEATASVTASFDTPQAGVKEECASRETRAEGALLSPEALQAEFPVLKPGSWRLGQPSSKDDAVQTSSPGWLAEIKAVLPEQRPALEGLQELHNMCAAFFPLCFHRVLHHGCTLYLAHNSIRLCFTILRHRLLVFRP